MSLMDGNFQNVVLIVSKYYKNLEDIKDITNYIEKLKSKNLLNPEVCEYELKELKKTKQEIKNHIDRCLLILKSN